MIRWLELPRKSSDRSRSAPAPPVSTAVFAPAAEAALEARIQALLAAPRGAAH